MRVSVTLKRFCSSLSFFWQGTAAALNQRRAMASHKAMKSHHGEWTVFSFACYNNTPFPHFQIPADPVKKKKKHGEK